MYNENGGNFLGMKTELK